LLIPQKYTSEPFTPFRLFYYPADVTGRHEDATVRWGVGEHTDYGVLTLLAQDEIGGLQVWRFC
jgi:isopenicillin N synthase-like dioxygenase